MINPISNQTREHITSNEVVTKFNTNTSSQKIKEYHSKINATVIEENDFLGFQVISSNKSTEEIMTYYRKIEDIEYVQPNHVIRIM